MLQLDSWTSGLPRPDPAGMPKDSTLAANTKKQSGSIGKRGPGRPAFHPEGSKQHKRRVAYHEKKKYDKEHPDAPTRQRGRPRSGAPKRPDAALNKRTARVREKVIKIVNDAANQVREIATDRPESWNEAFTKDTASTFVDCVRQVATTPSGAAALPGLADHEGKRQILEEVGRGTVEILKEGVVGGGAYSSLTKLSSKYVLDLKRFAGMIGKTCKYVIRARKKFDIAKCLKLNYDLASGAQYAVYRRATLNQLAQVIECFFLRNSNCRSGQTAKKRTTFRELPMRQKDLYILWYSEYPGYCREAARTWASWFKTVSSKAADKRTKFERDVHTSVESKPADVAAELNSRRVIAVRKYHERLAGERFRWRSGSMCNSKAMSLAYDKQCLLREEQELASLAQLDEQEVSSEDQVGQRDDPVGNLEINPPSLKYFFRVIKQLKYTWSANVYPTECPIHDNGPELQIALNLAEATLLKTKAAYAAATSAWRQCSGQDQQGDDIQRQQVIKDRESTTRTDFADALSKFRSIRQDYSNYVRHLEQYASCRSVVKQIESNLKPGEAVLYRDFVAQYMTGGSKLSNLVFVILWHSQAGGVHKYEHVMKFNHFCGDKTTRKQDAYYMADVWKWFLGDKGDGSTFLERNNIHTLFVSGDHGPHFSSIQTMYNESTFYQTYGVRLHCYFLCSYHCYNRCDAAGVESKRLHQDLVKMRKAIALAADVADTLNKSELHNSVGVPFDQIDRGDKVFDVPLAKDTDLDLRGKCEVKYEWIDETGNLRREPGVILCRDVPAVSGEGEKYQVFDLRKTPPGGPLCKLCSYDSQRPIWHQRQDECTKSRQLEVKLSAEKKASIADGVPAASRLQNSGVQLTADFKENMKKKPGEFPCRVDGCIGYHWYATRHHSNSHMTNFHKLPANDSKLYPKIVKTKKARSRPKKVAAKPTPFKPLPLPTATASTAAPPTPYEVKRLQNIAENNAHLAAIDLLHLPTSPPRNTGKQSQGAADEDYVPDDNSDADGQAAVPVGGLRRGLRLRPTKSYVEDSTSEDDENLNKSPAKSPFKSGSPSSSGERGEVVADKSKEAKHQTAPETSTTAPDGAAKHASSSSSSSSNATAAAGAGVNENESSAGGKSKEAKHQTAAETSAVVLVSVPAVAPLAPEPAVPSAPAVTQLASSSSPSSSSSNAMAAAGAGVNENESSAGGKSKEAKHQTAAETSAVVLVSVPAVAPLAPEPGQAPGAGHDGLDDAPGVAEAPLEYTTMELEQESNEGHNLLYLYRDESSGAGWLFCGRINKTPTWDDEDGNLYIHTRDYVCTEDVHFPETIQDGKFYFPVGPPTTEPNWTVVTDELSVLVLCVFKDLNSDHKLPLKAKARACAILESKKTELPFVEAFLAMDPALRTSSVRPKKRSHLTAAISQLRKGDDPHQNT